MAATINQTIFRAELLKGLNQPSYIDQAFSAADSQFELQKSEFISQIEENEITKELKAGFQDPAGYQGELTNGYGNLYSFIGFDIHEGDPTKPVLDLLQEDIKLKRTSLGAQYKNNKITYQFPLQYPSQAELENLTPMPWGTSRSWLNSVERGIDNFNSFLSRNFSYDAIKSRSTGGKQLKTNLGHGGNYTPPADGYVITKLKLFINKFR